MVDRRFFGSSEPPTINVGNVESQLVNVERSVLFDIDAKLAVMVPGAQFAMRHRPGWDGRYHPFHGVSGRFPTGILGSVRRAIPVAQVVDQRERPHHVPPDADIVGTPLRDYQFRAIQAVLAQDRGALSGRATLGISVGGGKTLTGLAIAMHVPGKCVVIVHRKDLLHQWLEEIKRFIPGGEIVAPIGDGAWDERAADPMMKFVVAMPQSVSKSPEEFFHAVKDAKVLLIDEAHRATSDVWYKMVQRIPAYFRIGLTGTPDLEDPVKAIKLKAATGPVIFKVGAATLAAMGHLVPCRVIVHRIVNPAVFGDWHAIHRMLIEDNAGRNDAIVTLTREELARGRKVLILCNTVRHSRNIRDELVSLGITVQLVTGQQGSHVRNKARYELKAGTLECVISTTWTEGVNIPNLDVVVIAAGGRSSVLLLQRVGRALRTAPGKKIGIVHDFHDGGHRYVLNHSMQRLQVCQHEKFEVVQGRSFAGKPGDPPRSVVDDVEVHEVDEPDDVVEDGPVP